MIAWFVGAMVWPIIAPLPQTYHPATQPNPPPVTCSCATPAPIPDDYPGTPQLGPDYHIMFAVPGEGFVPVDEYFTEDKYKLPPFRNPVEQLKLEPKRASWFGAMIAVQLFDALNTSRLRCKGWTEDNWQYRSADRCGNVAGLAATMLLYDVVETGIARQAGVPASQVQEFQTEQAVNGIAHSVGDRHL